MGTTLKRTTIFLTPEQHEQLRRIAFERRTSMAQLIRDVTIEVLKRCKGTDKDGKNRGEWI
ncbi:MAG: hypothetical protein HYY41_00435 [Chloroflexi bacterium]|nr:hypothetical protein [Chloroflexota bacterium]MBI2979293.1 hypothetical protein [Chloroflexota bacterium]